MKVGTRLVFGVALVLASVGVSIVAASTPGSSVPQVGLTPSNCADDGAQGCIAQIPCSTAPCPTVDVSPNSDLRDAQSVTIKATNFPSTDSFRVAVCSGTTSATDPSCLGGVWENTSYKPISVPVTDSATQHNLTSVTYPVFLDPSGEGNNLIPALDILDQNNNTPGFYCDNLADPCYVVVTDETGQGPGVGFGPPVDPTTGINSVVIPLIFRSQTSGCPPDAPTLNTDGSASVEQLLPTAVDATCSGPTGVTAVNTTLDTASVVSDFASGGAALGFIDNPQDPSQLAPLKGKAYALVPVAVSASTVSYLAGDILNSLSVPISSYNLTPNMVAGLITSTYQSPTGSPQFLGGKPYFGESDNLVSALAAGTPPVTCAELYNCPTLPISQLYFESNLDGFDLFNQLSTDAMLNGGETPQQFGSFMSDVPTGASYEATDWLCHAPNPALTATVFENDANFNPVATQVKVVDPNSAPATLTTAPSSTVWPPAGDSNAPWVFPKCQGTSKFPSISGSSDFFSAAQSPALQAAKMRGWAYGGGQLPQPIGTITPIAAFGIMDSSEASFYGLNMANLENASGTFVAPTTTSVEAGLAAAQPCSAVTSSCPAGTYSFDYSNPDPAAYPMPDITYAIVPTVSQSAATTTAIQNLVTNLINFSTSAVLPAGYYPMPAGMAQAALTDLHTALYGSPPSASSAAVPPSNAPSASSVYSIPSTSGSTDSGVSSSQPSSDATNGSSQTPVAAGTTTTGSSSSPKKIAATAAPPPPVIPHDLSLISLNTVSRLVLPSALVAALVCLFGGFLILSRARSTRRRNATGDVP